MRVLLVALFVVSLFFSDKTGAEVLTFDELSPEMGIFSYQGFEINAGLYTRTYDVLNNSRSNHPMSSVSPQNLALTTTSLRGQCAELTRTNAFTLNSLYISSWAPPQFPYIYCQLPTHVRFYGYKAGETGGASYFSGYKFPDSGQESYDMQQLQFQWSDIVKLRICPYGGRSCSNPNVETAGKAVVDNIVFNEALPTPTPTPPLPPEEQCEYRQFGAAVVCY